MTFILEAHVESLVVLHNSPDQQPLDGTAFWSSHLFVVVLRPLAWVVDLTVEPVQTSNLSSSTRTCSCILKIPFKSQSPGDPCTVTEQCDVNQQASAVCLGCFWFACDHANSLWLMFFSFSVSFFFLSVHLFYWLKFEFVRHSLWTGWMNPLSGERRSRSVQIRPLVLHF